ncbi:MAG TPA: hypothetical protein VGB74_06110, partial [Actinoplanes sp.]
MATNWNIYNLPAIADMLRGENVCTAADRVLAWEGLATSVREQHRRLVKAGEDLAAVWPPEKNASALLFLNEIDRLAASMQETLTYAEDTRVGLRGVTEAIGAAQTTVRTLADGRSAVSNDVVPRFIDHAEDEYDAKAQQAMRAAESAIAEHRTQIKAPTLFVMQPSREGTSTTLVNEDDMSSSTVGSVAVQATPVPVAVPHDPVLPDAARPSGSPAVAGPSNGSGQDPTLGIGLGLSGVTATPPPPAPAVGVPAGLPTVPGPGSGPAAGLPVGPGALGLPPGASGAGGFGAGGFGVPGGRAGAQGGRQAVPMRRGLPSGAVIGEG